MTNMSIQPLWWTYFIEIILVLEFKLTKTYFGTFSYKAHFRPQISSNVQYMFICLNMFICLYYKNYLSKLSILLRLL